MTTNFDAFARFYDDDYRDYADDLPLLLDLAQETGDPILELGCGTGRALLPLAADGHHVTGIDISPALLAVAHQKIANSPSLAGKLALVEQDMVSFDLPQKDFAFAFCVSNTLMHCATQAAQLAALRTAHRHLRPGGLLLLDLFNPDIERLLAVNGVQELADFWDDATTGAQVYKWSVRTVDVAEQLQETLFIYEEIFPDGQTRRTLCPFTIRFLWRGEGELMLRMAGFTVEAVWGDFQQALYHGGSEHLIFLASK